MSFQFAVAGLGYVGLSNAVLLSQRFPVIACDVSAERVDLINAKQSPIIDPELQDYLASKPLDLKATLDPHEAYGQATHVIIATPTNYDPDTNLHGRTGDQAGARPQRSGADRHQVHHPGRVGEPLA